MLALGCLDPHPIHSAPVLPNRRTTIAGLLFVVLMPTILLAPSLFGARTFVPFDIAEFAPVATMLSQEDLERVREGANHDPTEVVLTFIPELRFARQELAAGRIPHWNPHSRIGAPLQSTAVVGLDYPPNWLVLAYQDPRDGLALGAWLSFVIAGLLMFGFLSSLGLGTAAVTFGALAFAISGTLVAQAHFYQRLAVLVWLPGLLWGVRAIARSEPASWLAVVGLSSCVAMTWLSGFPQYGAPAFLVTGVFAVACLFGREGWRARLRGGCWLGFGFVLGTAAAGALLAPMAEFFPESSRGAEPTAGSLAQVAMGPAGFLGWVMPSVFGHPHLGAELPYDRSAMAYWLLSRPSWEDVGVPTPTAWNFICLLYTSPSPRDRTRSRMPSSA